MQIIMPVYSYLAKVLVRKAQQPDEDSIDKWTSDDLETFRCYRQDISDTMVNLPTYICMVYPCLEQHLFISQMYCYEVLHERLLDILTNELNESIMVIRGDTSNWTQLGTFRLWILWILFTLDLIDSF